MDEDEAQRILELLESKDDRIRTLEQTLLRLQSANRNIQAEYGEIRRQYRLETENLQSELNRQKQELSSLYEAEDTHKQVTSVCNTLQQENDTLKQSVESFTVKLLALTNKLEKAQAEANHFRQTSESHFAMLETLQRSICSRDEEIERLRDFITDLQRQHATAEMEFQHNTTIAQSSMQEIEQKLQLEQQSHEGTCRKLNTTQTALDSMRQTVHDTIKRFEAQFQALRDRHQTEIKSLKQQISTKSTQANTSTISIQTDDCFLQRLWNLEKEVTLKNRTPRGVTDDSDGSTDHDMREPLPSSCARFQYLSRFMDFESSHHNGHIRYPDEKYLYELQKHVLELNKEHGSFVDRQMSLVEDVFSRFETITRKFRVAEPHVVIKHSGAVTQLPHHQQHISSPPHILGSGSPHSTSSNCSAGLTRLNGGSPKGSSKFNGGRHQSNPDTSAQDARATEHTLRSIEQNIERITQSVHEREEESKQIVRIVQDKVKTTMWRLQEDIMADVNAAVQQVNSVRARQNASMTETSYINWLERQFVEAIQSNSQLRAENVVMAQTPNVAVTSYRHCASMLVDSFSTQTAAMVSVIVDALSLLHKWVSSRRAVELMEQLYLFQVSTFDDLAQDLLMRNREQNVPETEFQVTENKIEVPKFHTEVPRPAIRIDLERHTTKKKENNSEMQINHQTAGKDQALSTREITSERWQGVTNIADAVARTFDSQRDLIKEVLTSELAIQTRTQQLFVSLSSVAAATQGILSALQESLCLTSGNGGSDQQNESKRDGMSVIQEFVRACKILQDSNQASDKVVGSLEPMLRRSPRSRGVQTSEEFIPPQRYHQELQSANALTKELSERVRLLENQKAQHEKDISQLQLKVTNTRKELDVKRQLIEDLRARLSKAKEEQLQSKAKLEDLQRKHTHAKGEVRRLSDRVNQLQTERTHLKEGNLEQNATREELNKLSDLSKIARRDAKREKERSERLTVEIEELQEQLSWARREYVEYQQRAALNARQLQGEIQHLRAVCHELSQDLDDRDQDVGKKNSQATQTDDSGVDSSVSDGPFSQDRVMRNVQSLLNLTDTELVNILNA